MASEAEVRECLFRLKTECEIEGMDKRPGFDAWVAWADRLLHSQRYDRQGIDGIDPLAGPPLDAPVSRPGRLASEDARAEATRLPEQPSPGVARQSRGQIVPFALASQSKTDAAARTAPAGEAAEVEDEIDFVEATLERARLAEKRATAAEAALAQARAALRQVEWSGTHHSCPVCDAVDPNFYGSAGCPGHAPGCALAAELDADTACTVDTRRDGPAPGVPVVEPKGRRGGA